ncbi:hypothetical protein ACFQ61_02070 [Streptomyces sp. NPDC056500]|uniref:hypothetical protein n=1 Tax=Streptomyces sp. NPDC056500 TaxID=3345840 RepID=UPI00368275A5
MSTDEKPTGTALQRLQANLLALHEQFERDREEEIRAHADSQLDNDALTRLAHDYARAATPEQRDDLAARTVPALTLDQAGVIRRIAKGIERSLPGIILRAAEDGDTPAEIARELGYAEDGSHVRRIIREYTLCTWRLDLYDSTAGAGWQSWESGDDVIPVGTEPALAQHIIATAGSGPREHRARVLIWRGTAEQPDTAAIHAHEHDPAEQAEPAETEAARRQWARAYAKRHNGT